MQLTYSHSFWILCLLLLPLTGCLKKSKQDLNHRKKHSISRSKKIEAPEESSVEAFSLDGDLEDFALSHNSEHANQPGENNNSLFRWEDPTVEDSKEQFKTLYFAFDSNKLNKDDEPDMHHNIKYAKRMIKKGKTVVIEGHSCHSAGSATYNLALSEKRAQHVAQQCKDAGCKTKYIKVVGRGQEMPLRKGGSRKEQWPNRRVEMFAIDL